VGSLSCIAEENNLIVSLSITGGFVIVSVGMTTTFYILRNTDDEVRSKKLATLFVVQVRILFNFDEI